ncbi:MAG: GNAT family N-acetyltransferase [Burkholderiaceae bacterium]
MHLHIRAATSDDAQIIADMTRAAWAGKVADTSSGHRETAMLVSTQLRQGGGFILLINDQPSGSVRWLPTEDKSDVWEILRMGLLPDFRGNNFSKSLLEAVIHHALANKVRELRLAVRVDQPRLLDLYAAYGFEQAPELTYAHANPSEPAPIVMRTRLTQ